MMIAVAWAFAVATAFQGEAPKAAPSSPVPLQAAQNAPVSDDIVVTGLRDIEAPDSPVTARTLGSLRTGSAVASRTAFGHSSRLARCAILSTPNYSLLRGAIDSRSNSTRQAFFMRRLAQTNAACLPDPRAGSAASSYYDHGALVIQAINTFAPMLRLTKAVTADPVVQRRFDAREIPLASFRLPVDRQYFEVAVCLVRLQPELALHLVRTEKLDSVRRLEAAIVTRARLCVGNAKRVYFDGVQFRFYIADAVYRWAVAAKGVDSLIPTS